MTSVDKPSIQYSKHLDEQQSNLLLFGYMRYYSSSIFNAIPDEIIMLCLSFYYQSLPPYRTESDKCIVLEKEKIFSTTAEHPAFSVTFAIFTTPWNNGIHEISFECIHSAGSAIGIGIITNVNANCKQWLFDNCESKLSYQIYSCKNNISAEKAIYCFQNGKEKFKQDISNNKTYITDGVVVSLKVDFTKWTITFYFNDTKVGKTVPIEKNKTYYPAIAY
eukprot:254578_1